jgi:HAD superfamily hydrolase (TIGR01458 family)
MHEIDGALLDIDGVLVLSWQPIDGAPEALAGLRDAGLALRFVTNTTSASRQEVARRLSAAGFAVGVDEIFTAPVATAAWIRRKRAGARCYLINSGDLGEDLEGIGLVDEDEPAEIVLLGGAGPEFSYEQMNHALGLLLGGAELVAMHRNRYWRTATGFSLDTGAYLAALEVAAGATAVVLGKPAPEFFRTALDHLDLSPERVLMVGDDIENDVLAAQAVGLNGVLVRTGKYRPEAVQAAAGRPDHVLESFAAIGEVIPTMSEPVDNAEPSG